MANGFATRPVIDRWNGIDITPSGYNTNPASSPIIGLGDIDSQVQFVHSDDHHAGVDDLKAAAVRRRRFRNALKKQRDRR